MIIQSGTGNGQSAGVNEEKELLVHATTISESANIAATYGLVYSWSAAKDIDATDTILLVTNTSSTLKLYIDEVHVGSDASTRITLHSPAYTTFTGDAVTGVNTNRGSGLLADATAYQDETANTQANILCQGMVLANMSIGIPIRGRCMLGYHDSIAVDIVAEPTMATCTIIGYYAA